MHLSQAPSKPFTAVLALANGKILRGFGVGATGEAVAEVCFNTAMTGYQEILTDPSYAEQIVTFTFPHIGNVGANLEDLENATAPAAKAAKGAIFREKVTSPSNYRAHADLSSWMEQRGIIGLYGIDTRALTNMIRSEGMPHGVIAHAPNGQFDEAALIEKAKAWNGLEGADLAVEVTTAQSFDQDEAAWQWDSGFGDASADGPHILVIDFGVKANILRLLAEQGARVTVAPAKISYEEIAKINPDGVVLSNGPGDPAATALHAGETVRKLIENKVPTFGICLGHQILALAVGAKTVKMRQGHHGANHPVKNLKTGKVEIVSMNHGFTVDMESLPDNIEATFQSLFDGTNSGLRLKDAPAQSVQHHPEASPGPQDSFGVFKEFVAGL